MSDSLTIRRLDVGVKARLRQVAAMRGHSMEEEARQILGRALMQDRPMVGLASSMKAIFGQVDLDGFEVPRRTDSVRDPFA